MPIVVFLIFLLSGLLAIITNKGSTDTAAWAKWFEKDCKLRWADFSPEVLVIKSEGMGEHYYCMIEANGKRVDSESVVMELEDDQ